MVLELSARRNLVQSLNIDGALLGIRVPARLKVGYVGKELQSASEDYRLEEKLGTSLFQ